MIKVVAQSLEPSDIYIYYFKLWYFALGALIIMGLNIYNIVLEDEKFFQSLNDRFIIGPEGEEHLTYGSKISLISNSLIFSMNFCLALVYSQLVESTGFQFWFLMTFILQLVILFFVSKLIGIQIRILAIDYDSDFNKQKSQFTILQLKIYLLALIFIICSYRIFFNRWCIFVFIASIWVP